VREALDVISELSGQDLDVTYTSEERGDVRDTSADTTRARRDLGFAPATSLREGLAAELEWIAGTLADTGAARR
jgi:UDP-glucose 4-epimerase